MPGDKTVGVPGSTRLEQHTDGRGGVKSDTTILRREMSITVSHDRIDVEASIRYHNRCPGLKGKQAEQSYYYDHQACDLPPITVERL